MGVDLDTRRMLFEIRRVTVEEINKEDESITYKNNPSVKVKMII